ERSGKTGGLRGTHHTDLRPDRQLQGPRRDGAEARTATQRRAWRLRQQSGSEAEGAAARAASAGDGRVRAWTMAGEEEAAVKQHSAFSIQHSALSIQER